LEFVAEAEHRMQWVAAPVSVEAQHRPRWAVAPVSVEAAHRTQWAAAPVSAAEHRLRWAAAPASAAAEHRPQLAARVWAQRMSAAFAPAAVRVSVVRLTSAARIATAGRRYRGLRRGQVHSQVSVINAPLRFTVFRTGLPAAAQD
jgi:hypothetical protein